MKILQSISSLDPRQGGVASCTYPLVFALNRRVACDLVAFESQEVCGRDPFIHFLPRDGRTSFGFSRNFRAFCDNIAPGDYDVFHANGLWQYPAAKLCSTARKLGKPYVVSPHGMLYPQALARSAWKKRLVRFFVYDAVLSHADCLHATCRAEMEVIRELGFRNPVAVIPNAVMLPGDLASIQGDRTVPKVGYLGRLHPRKNIELLIDIWEKAAPAEAQLRIMGKGDDDYEAYLREKVQKAGLKNVFFDGFVSGDEKFQILSSLRALAVPSDFENFGMIVTEALACGTPVIATTGAPWEELETHHCGYWVKPEFGAFSRAVRRVLTLSLDEVEKMGRNGRELVSAHYHQDAVAGKMLALYRWLLHQGEKPDFIDVCITKKCCL